VVAFPVSGIVDDGNVLEVFVLGVVAGWRLMGLLIIVNGPTIPMNHCPTRV